MVVTRTRPLEEDPVPLPIAVLPRQACNARRWLISAIQTATSETSATTTIQLNMPLSRLKRPTRIHLPQPLLQRAENRILLPWTRSLLIATT